jgi:hypothetical protein
MVFKVMDVRMQMKKVDTRVFTTFCSRVANMDERYSVI